MGLLKHLLAWPVTGPLFLAEYSVRQVDRVVRDELTDDGRIREALLELHLRLDLGDIEEEEYLRREAELMGRLREVRAWREWFGLGVQDGPVRVARDRPA